MTAYEKVKAARDPARPTATDYINSIFAAFTEMHGDRRYSDDGAVVTGLALLGSMPVTVIGLEKGHDIKERVARNFGCAHPEGYRKALRQMKLAEKFRRPIVCFVDTSGAYCGIGAEERGQAQAIAENLYEMSALKTPILSVFIGEGGSGGALGLAVADEVWMTENAVYSVISPEGLRFDPLEGSRQGRRRRRVSEDDRRRPVRTRRRRPHPARNRRRQRRVLHPQGAACAQAARALRRRTG